MERLNELPLKIEYREGPLNVVADILSRIPQRDQLHLDDATAAMAAQHLRKVAPQFIVKMCVDAAVSGLAAGVTT